MSLENKNKYNDVKSKQLGDNYQKLTQTLKRNLLYHYVKLANKHICYRCNEEIDSPDNFSVDHMQPWMYSDNAYDLFFDITNIAFSHKSCNYKNRRQNISRLTKCGYKGVIKVNSGRYQAIFHWKKKQIYLGTFDDPNDAARAYDAKCIEMHGEKAITNLSLGLITDNL